MYDIVLVIFKFIHMFIERSIQYSSELSGQTMRKRDAYTLLCMWMHSTFQVW